MLRRVLTRRLALYRSLVVVPSQRLYRIARDVWRLPAARLFHIPNGIDCERFNTAPDLAFAEAMGVAGDVPVIGTVARLSPEKNLERLVEAFAKVLQQRRALLVIVGDGTTRPAIAARAATLGVADLSCSPEHAAAPSGCCRCFRCLRYRRILSRCRSRYWKRWPPAGRSRRPMWVISVTCWPRRTGRLSSNAPPMRSPRRSRSCWTTRAALPLSAPRTRDGREEMFDQRIMFAHYRRLFDGSAPVLSDRLGQVR